MFGHHRIDDDSPDEYSTEDELPDNLIDSDGIGLFSLDSNVFEDVNGFAAAEGEATMTAEERVRSVVNWSNDSMTVEEISEVAVVSKDEVQSVLAELEE